MQLCSCIEPPIFAGTLWHENNIVESAFLVYNTFNKASKLLSQRSLGKKGQKPGRTPREFPL